MPFETISPKVANPPKPGITEVDWDVVRRYKVA